MPSAFHAYLPVPENLPKIILVYLSVIVCVHHMKGCVHLLFVTEDALGQSCGHELCVLDRLGVFQIETLEALLYLILTHTVFDQDGVELRVSDKTIVVHINLLESLLDVADLGLRGEGCQISSVGCQMSDEPGDLELVCWAHVLT